MNPNSPAQVAAYANSIGIKALKWTKGGKTGDRKPSWDSSTLEHYRNDVPAFGLILDHREYSKLLGTYIIGLHELLDPFDRIHANFNQDVARCMPAGELVLTNRGYIPVETVKKGDLVLSHTGTPRKVTATSKHVPSPIYRVTLNNGMTLRTNGQHPYLSGADWVRADCLVVGNNVSVYGDKEVWADVPEWPGYTVSSWGRVRGAQGVLLVQSTKDKYGHLRVTLSRNGAQSRKTGDRKDITVHRLVMSAFAKAQETKPLVRHKNGVAWDNTVHNLVYGTTQENIEAERRWSGRAEKEHEVPFTEATVVSIEVEKAQATYGLTVDVDHSHVTGGIVTHNTGRLSCSDPNLQNIPRPENDHWNLRGAFITEPGWKVIDADYSQLEMRLLAAAAQEQPMVDIFLRGWDIHAGNAALMFNLPYDDIDTSKDLLKKMGKLTPEDALNEAESKLPGVSQRAAEKRVSLDAYLRDCAACRSAAKNIGFGQRESQAEVKPAQNGEAYRLAA